MHSFSWRPTELTHTKIFFFFIFLYVKLFCNPYDIKIYYYKKVKKLIKKFSEPFWTLE